MGLYVSVYRDAEYAAKGIDCTMNGVSQRFYQLLVVNIDGPNTFVYDRDSLHTAPVILESHVPGCVCLRPAKFKFGKWVADGIGMMGGNYAATSDSRWTEAIEKILGHGFYGAVAIHDRFER